MRASHRAVEAPRLCKGSPQGDERTGGAKGDFRRRSAALARAAERKLPGGRVGTNGEGCMLRQLGLSGPCRKIKMLSPPFFAFMAVGSLEARSVLDCA